MTSSILLTNAEAPTRILVVDDHPFFSAGLSTGLTHLYPQTTCCTAASLALAREQLLQHTDIDLILLDMSLAGDEGLDLMAMLDTLALTIPVIVISSRDDSLAQLNARRKGAMAFINKASEGSTLKKVIEQVMSGRPCFDAQAEPRRSTLTPRQMDVLNLLAQGLPNKRICDRLNLTEHTIKSHLKIIFSELGVHNRTECVQTALRLGLVDSKSLPHATGTL